MILIIFIVFLNVGWNGCASVQPAYHPIRSYGVCEFHFGSLVLICLLLPVPGLKKANCDFCGNLEDETDVRLFWQGLHTIKCYKAKPSGSSNDSELNRSNWCAFLGIHSPDIIAISVTEADVRSFTRVNICEASGPDGASGLILKICVNQLVGDFVDMVTSHYCVSFPPTLKEHQ